MKMPHLSPGWPFSSSILSQELEFTYCSRGAREEPQVKAAELGKEQAQATACQCLWEAALQDKSLRSLCPGKQKTGERHLEYITEETSPGNRFYSVLLTGLRG